MERTGMIGRRLFLVAVGGVGLTIAMAATSGMDAAAAAELAAWACAVVMAGAGTVGVAVVLGRRVAAQGRQLDDVVRRVDEATRAERAVESSRRELVAWVSHDLSAPLASLRAVIEALEDNIDDDPVTVARYHRTLRQEADRLALLVDDLHELSSLQSGSPEPVAGPTSSDPIAPEPIAADLPSDLVADAGAG